MSGLIQAWLDAKPDRTLGQLARETGLSKSYLSRLRSGERQGLRPDTIAPLAQGLRISLEELSRVVGVAIIKVPADTFRKFVTNDSRLVERQKKDLLHTYYETFGVRDGSNLPE